MMGKSLNYAYPTVYADGGPVLAVPQRDVQLQFTPEQQQQMDEANARRIAAEASSAKSKAESAAIRAANPNIDFSDEGYAAALADAQRFLAEYAPIGHGAGGNPRTQSPGTPQPVDTTGGFDVGDVTLPNPPVTPEYQPQPAFTYTPPPTTFTELTGIGENAGQSNYQDFVAANPQQTAVQYSSYAPPTFQGVGSIMTPLGQENPYLMYSNPTNNVFKRPGGG